MSQTTTTTTAVTVTTADRIQKVQQELETLVRISDQAYNTAGKRIIAVDISTATSIEALIELDAAVKTMQASYDKSLEDKISKGLLKQAKPFAIEGVMADSIIADIDLRLRILTTEERRKLLQDIKKGYEDLMDKDDKRALLDAQLLAYSNNLTE